MSIVADPDEISQLDTVTLFASAIGADAFRAARAAAEVQRRGAEEARRAFTSVWSLRPIAPTTENFVRDAFASFGDGFAHHLAGILEDGTQSAVDVAVLASLAAAFHREPGDRSGRGRKGGAAIRSWRVARAGVSADCGWLRGVDALRARNFRRADHVRADVCARALVRMFVQSASAFDARTVLDALTMLIAEAYEQQWPNAHVLLRGHLPAWPLTSAAIDVLVEQALGPTQPEEIRIFASDALVHADARHVASAVILALRADDRRRRRVTHARGLGGPDAATFVYGRTRDHDSLARVSRGWPRAG